MTARRVIGALVIALALALSLAVLNAAEPCRNETICSQYEVWHPYYWWHNCDKAPCGQEPM
jgi:hypothetical protein